MLLDLLALLGVRLEDKEFSGLSRYIFQMSSYVAFWFSEYTCTIPTDDTFIYISFSERGCVLNHNEI